MKGCDTMTWKIKSANEEFYDALIQSGHVSIILNSDVDSEESMLIIDEAYRSLTIGQKEDVDNILKNYNK